MANKEPKIKMLDPLKTSRTVEASLVKKVISGDIEATMIFTDLGLRHVVDTIKGHKSRNHEEFLKILRRGLVGFYKAVKPYLYEKRYKKHKFTDYSTYFIQKEIKDHL